MVRCNWSIDSGEAQLRYFVMWNTVSQARRYSRDAASSYRADNSISRGAPNPTHCFPYLFDISPEGR
ncbi:hypothetical protein N7504_006417 [Penicillium tannophilum]|nr:hypothetical protein N7504_006417 [Penicillium tannophilum]